MPKLKSRAPLAGDHVGEFQRRRDAREAQNSRARNAKPPGLEVPVGTFSGFCLTEAEVQDGLLGLVAVKLEDLHAKCNSGFTNEAGKYTPCLCPGHDSEFKCHQCGKIHPANHEGEYDEEHRRCVGVEECAARIATRSAEYRKNSPLHQQIDQIHADIARRQEESRQVGLEAMRAANNRPRPESEPVTSPLSAETKAPGRGPARPAKFPQKCHDGCGGMTKGGRFIAGHDMKLKGRLFTVARSSDPLAEPFEPACEIVARGWNTMGISPDVLARAQGAVEEAGSDFTVKMQVRKRYGDDSLEVG